MLLSATSNSVGVNVRLIGYGLSFSRYQGIFTIEQNLNTRCSSASRRLSKMEFCWTAEVGEFSHSSSSLDCAPFTFCAIALNIRERVAMQCDSSPPFKVFDT